MTTAIEGIEVRERVNSPAILNNVLPVYTPSKEYVSPSYEEGFITIFTGLRGSGKSCKLAGVGMESMSCWERPTFSDFPIGGYIMGKKYEVEPLPNDFFVTYGRSIPRGSVIIVDELKEFFNRQEWFTVESKMGVSLFGQFRKLDFWLFGAMQFFHNLNSSVAEQVDVLVRCKDLHKTPWGREVHIGKGVESLCEWFDLSGEVSPDGRSARALYNPHLVTGDPYKTTVTYIKALREYFDTTHLTALERRFQKFKLQKTDIAVSAGGSGRVNTQQELKAFLINIFNSAHESGQKEIKAGQLQGMLHADGFTVHPSAISESLRKMGILGHYLRAGPEGEGKYYIVQKVGEAEQGFSPVPDDVKDAWLGKERGERGKKQGAQIFPD